MQSLHFRSRDKSHIPSLAVALVLLLSSASPTSSCTEKEKGSLLQFLEGISQDGGLAASWQRGTDCCTWEGITCSQYEYGTFIDVSLVSRNLEGKISSSLANLTSLRLLNLSHNSLSGVLPVQLMASSSIVVLDVSFNQLSGDLNQQSVPSSTPDLPLEVLDLSNNHLTGEIPAILSKMHFLSRFNISNNELEGPIPYEGQFGTFLNSSFKGNPKLCGYTLTRRCGSASTPPVSTKHPIETIFAISFGVFFGGLAILCVLGRLLASIGRLKGFTTTESTRGDDGDIEATSNDSSPELVIMQIPQGNQEGKNLGFNDILKATNNFDNENIIGRGGYGLVYKAELPDGSKLAIKKLSDEICLMGREFTAEIEALSTARHENLVPLWGYGIQRNSRLLVYSYMENGSIYDWLHNRDENETSVLDWPMRLKIACGASQGLCYIHQTCRPRIVHRDIKSSNILLDQEFKAYVADFGLARLILPFQTHVTTELAGTIGYIPPEYGQTLVATLRGDMYSFGVVLLELLTGRQPVEVESTSKELVPWVRQMRSRGKQIEVLDPALRGRGHEEQMLKVLEVACKCADHNPSNRPTIMEVVPCLGRIDADLQMQKSGIHGGICSI